MAISGYPKTIEEMQALPIGPAFATITKVIDGKKVTVPVAPATKATHFPRRAPTGYSDETGRWALGQYADGSWSRRKV